MKPYRIVSLILLIVFLINAALPVASVKAQSIPLFEGTIAYVDSNGNVVITDGNGGRRQVTSDAYAQENASSKNRLPYGGLSFSPDGKYLAFIRDDSDSDGSNELLVYDVQNNIIIKEFEQRPAGFAQWHRESDSFIAMAGEDIDSIIPGEDYLNKIYRQYLSGDQVLIGEYYEGDAGQTINFDLDTVFYTPDSSTSTGKLYNWVKNTNFLIELEDRSVGGFWAPDERHYVWTGDEYFSVIELESGEIIKQINLHDIFPDL